MTEREEMLNECVSRDKAIVQLNHLQSDWDDDWNIAIRKCIETIKKLPSVTPQQRWDGGLLGKKQETTFPRKQDLSVLFATMPHRPYVMDWIC